jgi:hypothetical protein
MGAVGPCGERALALRPQGRLQPRSPRCILGAWKDDDQRWVGWRTRREYSRRRTGRYYSSEDRSRSPTPNHRGPWAFGVNVLAAALPAQYHAPTTVAKYDGETNPSVWLEDYRLACHIGGATNDLFIIKSIPLYLANSARTWLEHLPQGRINSWAQLQDAFIGHLRPAQQCLRASPLPAKEGRASP